MSIIGNKLSPITSRLAFIEAEASIVIDEFIRWQTPIVSQNNNVLRRQELNKNLEETFLSLSPLTTVEQRRFLFIPTNSKWTIFIDNGVLGTDRVVPKVLSEFLNTNTIYIFSDPIAHETLFEFYRHNELVRFVGVSKDNGWKFHQYGKPFDFEDITSFNKRLIKDRFTPSILAKYLAHFGIQLEDANFYKLSSATLVEKIGPKFNGTKELSLKELKKFYC